MSNLFFVVCIVAIACTTAVLCDYFKARAKSDRAKQAGISDETLAQLTALEERIRVLERIVTEKNYDLKGEIDRL